MKKPTTYRDDLNIFNVEMQKYAKEKKFDRNYIHLFRPHVNKPLIVTGTFEEAIKEEEAARGAQNFTQESRRSFGIISRSGFEDYKELLLKDDSPFANCKAFAEYVKQNCRDFCIDRDEYLNRKDYCDKYSFEDYQKAFFARCAAACSRAFGFTVKFHDDTCSKDFKEKLRSSSQVLLREQNDGKAQTDTVISVYGRIEEELITEFKDVKITLCSDGLPEKKDTAVGTLYSKENAAYFNCISRALYSGVIPRLCRMEYYPPGIGNSDIHRMTMHLGRTSFMAMYAFERTGQNENLLSHPFLTYKFIRRENGETVSPAEINRHFDQCEAKIQRRFYQKMADAGDSFENDLDALNSYLSESWNIHNINVSGNIFTSDSCCIYTRRSKGMEDASHIYCSVNGGSEINDTDVSYYRNSAEEDIPTIKYGKDTIYFGRELTREAVAELGISDNSPFWKYYGVTCMARYDKNKPDYALWLHFNVLGEKHCSDSFEQIQNQRLTASERFENDMIFGYSPVVISSRREFWIRGFIQILELLVDWKDIIMVAILIAVLGIRDVWDLQNGLSIAFAVLLLILLGWKKIEALRKRRTLKTVRVEKYNEQWFASFRKTLFRKKEKVDPIFLILSKLSLMSVLYSEK